MFDDVLIDDKCIEFTCYVYIILRKSTSVALKLIS